MRGYMKAELAIAEAEQVLPAFSAFLKEQLSTTGSVSVLPLWLTEAPEVERDWPRAVEYGVACVAETLDAWLGAAGTAVSVCSGDRLAWVAERNQTGIRWLTNAENKVISTAAVVTDARVRRLKTRDLLPMHRPSVYAGFVMVFTIGMRSEQEASGVYSIEVSVNTPESR